MTTLFVQDSGEFRPATQADVLTRAKELLHKRFRKGSPVLERPSSTRDFLRIHLADRDHEVFGLLFLDNRHRLICVEDMFRGTVDAAAVYPREVAKRALECNAAAAICYHNHPSGVAEPSSADELMTERLKETLALIEVRLLDHLVVGDEVYSFAEHGLI